MKKILVIEDDIFMAEQEVIVFKKEGFEVVTARNGTEGLNRALLDHPDLIVLDIILPDMNGKEVVDTLRADPWGANVPIVLFTNLNLDPQVLQEYKDKNASIYFLKVDVTTMDLAKKVKAILNIPESPKP